MKSYTNVEGSMKSVLTLEVNVDTVYIRSNIRRTEDDQLWIYDETQMSHREYMETLISKDATEEQEFRAMAQANVLATRRLMRQEEMSNEELLELQDIYDTWIADIEVSVGDFYKHKGELYKVITAHTTQSDWEPANAASLFGIVQPKGVIPIWEEKHGANAYKEGQQVTVGDGRIYQLIDEGWQAYEPPNEGWMEV